MIYEDLIARLRSKHVAVVHYNSCGMTSMQKAPDEDCADAADAIATLHAELAAAREERSSWRRTAERCETEKQAAEACVKELEIEMDKHDAEVQGLTNALAELREAAIGVVDAWPSADGRISAAMKNLRALVKGGE